MTHRGLRTACFVLLAALASCAPGAREELTPDQRVVPDPMLMLPTGCTGAGNVPDAFPCQCDADCTDGARCSTESATGRPHGRCVRGCTVSGAAVCAAGYVCAPAGSTSMGECRVACTGSSDVCPPDSACDALIHSCLDFCASDSECDSMHCNVYSGRCTDGTPPTGGGVYASCLRNEDCRSGLCAPAGHVCLVGCSLSRQTCPDGALCVTSQMNNDLGICYNLCDDPAAVCPMGTTCQNTLMPPGHGVCATP